MNPNQSNETTTKWPNGSQFHPQRVAVSSRHEVKNGGKRGGTGQFLTLNHSNITTIYRKSGTNLKNAGTTSQNGQKTELLTLTSGSSAGLQTPTMIRNHPNTEKHPHTRRKWAAHSRYG